MVLGRSWGRLEAVLGRLVPSWGDLGASWKDLGAILGRLGAILGGSWAPKKRLRGESRFSKERWAEGPAAEAWALPGIYLR